jgi:hypothetical protein
MLKISEEHVKWLEWLWSFNKNRYNEIMVCVGMDVISHLTRGKEINLIEMEIIFKNFGYEKFWEFRIGDIVENTLTGHIRMVDSFEDDEFGYMMKVTNGKGRFICYTTIDNLRVIGVHPDFD